MIAPLATGLSLALELERKRALNREMCNLLRAKMERESIVPKPHEYRSATIGGIRIVEDPTVPPGYLKFVKP